MSKSCLVCPFIYTLLSIPIFILLYSYTAVIVLAILLLASFKWKRGVRFLLVFWARSCFAFMLKRLRVVGKENIESDARYILIANHTSLFDILAIMAFYPDVSFFGKEYLVRIPVFGKVLRMIDFVPMRSADLRNTKEMLAQLKEKSLANTVAIFPEGTRTRTGDLNRFRKGFLHLLRATEYPLLPVSLNGFFQLKPANRFYIDFAARLEVQIHEPIQFDKIRDQNDSELIFQVQNVIRTG